VINICIPILCDFLPPTEKINFKLRFCRRLAREGEMEITIRHGFKGQENVWWGEGREAAAGKNSCWSSNRAKVAACGRNPGCSQAHNLGTPTECLTAQQKIVAQRDFVAHHTKCVAQHHFVAQPSFVA